MNYIIHRNKRSHKWSLKTRGATRGDRKLNNQTKLEQIQLSAQRINIHSRSHARLHKRGRFAFAFSTGQEKTSVSQPYRHSSPPRARNMEKACVANPKASKPSGRIQCQNWRHWEIIHTYFKNVGSNMVIRSTTSAMVVMATPTGYVIALFQI